MTDLSNRLADLVDQQLDGNWAELGRKAGLKGSTLQQIKKGADPRGSTLLRISQATNTTVDWLLSGPAADTQELSSGYAASSSWSDDYAQVPLYDVRAAAGDGALVEEERVVDSLAFKHEWIQHELHASPQDLYLISVEGESMEPTLRPGDVILVDRRDAASLPRDGIYVLRLDGTLLVKRLQRLPGKIIRVTSDNAAYDAFELDLESDSQADDFAIIGRVLWAGRRM